MPFFHSIAQIEEFAKLETVYIAPQTNIPLLPPYASLPQRVVFSRTVFKGMVEAVWDRLLGLRLGLEKRGITGENMAFDEHEKEGARSQIFKIQHFTWGFGNVTHSKLYIK